MGCSDYHFRTQWRFEAEAQEVYQLLSRPENFFQWLKNFSVRVESLAPGDENGIGRKECFTVKGYLPYTLSWQMECVEAHPPFGFTSAASGDLEGRGIWTFTQRWIWTDVTFDWKVTARKPFLRFTSFILRPVFMWNHDWIMNRWETDLRCALAVSRAPSR